LPASHSLIKIAIKIAVYLDELGTIADLPPGLGLMVLTTLEGDVAIAEAKEMVARSRQAVDASGIIEVVAAILVAKFRKLHRDEVLAMRGYKVDEFKQSQFYQDVREEEQVALMLKQLTHKFGQLSPQNQEKIKALDFDQLELLSTKLLDFASTGDLEHWLDRA
jgi:predicted transposase YdaD